MKKDSTQNVILLSISILFCLLSVEIVLQFFISPSQNSYGTFFGRELPPLKLILDRNSMHGLDRSSQYKDLVIEGQKISVGDLWGIYREDPLLGYAPQENARSLNGWWQSNNIGARRSSDTPKEKPEGRKRILIFGESFSACTRVPQKDTWPAILESDFDRLEVLNFGVDGYSMAQAFLRFRQLKNRIDYDLALLTFAPNLDLWRDINIRRDLAGSWAPYPLMPRFIINEGELKLINLSSRNNLKDLQTDKNTAQEQIATCLERYDKFYSASLFQKNRFFAKSILYKLSVVAYHEYKKDKLRAELLEPDSEALGVSHRIFETMHDQVNLDGNKFVLVVLPTHHDLSKFHKSTSYLDKWTNMVSSTCALDFVCIDLTDDLYQLPESDLDTGYDGTHYGPRVNRQIAHFIMNHLTPLKAL